jgi:hypothetical protein
MSKEIKAKDVEIMELRGRVSCLTVSLKEADDDRGYTKK